MAVLLLVCGEERVVGGGWRFLVEPGRQEVCSGAKYLRGLFKDLAGVSAVLDDLQKEEVQKLVGL